MNKSAGFSSIHRRGPFTSPRKHLFPFRLVTLTENPSLAGDAAHRHQNTRVDGVSGFGPNGVHSFVGWGRTKSTLGSPAEQGIPRRPLATIERLTEWNSRQYAAEHYDFNERRADRLPVMP